MDGDLSHLGDKYEPGNADDIPDIEVTLENRVIQEFIIARTDLIAFHIDLDPAGVILYFGKRGCTHNSPAHDAAGNADFPEQGMIPGELLPDFRCGAVYGEGFRRIRIDPQVQQVPQRFTSYSFLFG
jgi:hypothetical protein